MKGSLHPFFLVGQSTRFLVRAFSFIQLNYTPINLKGGAGLNSPEVSPE
jgi:hypothetical protein